nr:nitroreductase family protein [Candidatus Baldrarchaeota archaeon]
MDVFECIKGRRSIRAFKPDPVNEEDLKKILDAAIHAPSAGNLQSWEFIVVRDKERKRQLARA